MKTSMIVLLAALSLGVAGAAAVATPVMAAAVCTTCSGGGGGAPADPGNPGNPGDPGQPGGEGGNDGGNDGGPGDDTPTPGESFASLKDVVCGEKLGQLRPVTEDAITDVGPANPIEVVEICRKRPLADVNTNVDGLHAALGANPVIDGELGHSGFEPEDVVGLILNDGAVVLYVHPRA
jgi:hypothetical protein